MRRSLSLIVLLCLVAFPARAQTMLRDGDIENALRALAAPVLAAAGLSTSRTRIVVLQDRQMNAFVLDREHIFLHSGLILRLKTAEQRNVIELAPAQRAIGSLS